MAVTRLLCGCWKSLHRTSQTVLEALLSYRGRYFISNLEELFTRVGSLSNTKNQRGWGSPHSALLQDSIFALLLRNHGKQHKKKTHVIGSLELQHYFHKCDSYAITFTSVIGSWELNHQASMANTQVQMLLACNSY